MRDKVLLRQLQALPLDAKVLMTQQRIREWYNYWNGDVYISFSGGKDSTVLTHLVHDMYPDVPLVFANTGLEYPEIQAFARQMGAEFVRPKMSFSEVISKYGYPIIGKEIAEAISYARRIVLNSEGGVERRKRNEQKCEESESTELHGRTGWRRANLTGNTPLPKKEPPGTSRDKAYTPPPPQEKTEKQSEEDQTSTGTDRTTKDRKIQKAAHGEVMESGQALANSIRRNGFHYVMKRSLRLAIIAAM